MIGVIFLPHQLPPTLAWHVDTGSVISAAIDHAAWRDSVWGEGDCPIEEAADNGYIVLETLEDAVNYLADDDHGYLLVQSADDIERVREYAGHQFLAVKRLIPELVEIYAEQQSCQE